MKYLLIFILSFSNFILAGTTGKIVGTITDKETGEFLPGVNIIVEGTNFGAATDISGNYIILNIKPGTYRLKISAVGYISIIVEDVRIVADRTTNVSVQLELTSLQMDEIIVTAKTPLIQKDKTSTVSVMTRDEIEELPVASFTELISMQAGVVGSGNNLHIRGGRSNEIAFLVDGMYVQDPLLGGLATQINNDAIQELSLLSGTFNAEYGNALSGIVNIVTRDGSDKFSGKLEIRTSEFGIKQYSDFNQLRINGNFSGPLFADNLNFFISGEQDQSGSYLPFGWRFDKSFFSKLTYSGIKNFKLSASNRGSFTKNKPYNHSYRYIPEQYLEVRSDSYQSSFTATHTIANNLFYDLKVSYFNQGYYSGINKDTSEYLSTGDFVYFEEYGNGFEFYSLANPLSLTESRTSTLDIKADMLWQFNNINEVKFGIQYKKHWLKLFSIYDPKRNFPYKNNYDTQPFEAAVYLQDKIELPYLIINLGLRYDYMNANVDFREDPLFEDKLISSKPRTQLSPRIGIAHPISENTKLHFAYGHFFQNPEYQFLFENNQYDLNVREPLFGQPNLDAQRTIAYEVGISHQFNDKMAVNLTAYYKDVTGLIGTRYYFPFVDGRYTGYTLYVNEDYANMRGFEVNFDARGAKYFSGGLTYTFSIAKGSASSETEQYPGTQESTQLYYLDFDKTHVINASATFFIPKSEGFELFGYKILENTDLSLIFRGSSGYPYTPGGRDIGFVERNSLRYPANYTVNLEFGKNLNLTDIFKLRVFVEVLNLTNNKNVLYVYPDTGEPDITFVGDNSDEYINNPANFGSPRYIRLGASIRF